MRMDDSLGLCIVGCGRYAAYANTLECRNCYKKRRRKGLPPVPIEGYAIYRYNFDRRPLQPRSDGRQSVYAQRLIEDARRAFLTDTGYAVAIAQDAQKLMNGFVLKSNGVWQKPKEKK